MIEQASTILGLQFTLAQEINRILRDVDTMNAAGEWVHGVPVYQQNLPVQQEPIPVTELPVPGESVVEPTLLKQSAPDGETSIDSAENIEIVRFERQEDYFPYALVRVYEGGAADSDKAQNAWEALAIVHLGVFDEDPLCQGHQYIMVMIQRIIDRFSHEPILEPWFTVDPQGIEYTIQEDADGAGWPMFFGGVALPFIIPRSSRRWPF